MKKRFLALCLALCLIVSLLPATTLAADTGTILYLKPNANWKADNARFAAYFFGNGEKWVSMTAIGGDIYEVTAPAGYPSVIFCRMNPSATANNWDNKWNQTGDLTVPTDGTNLYTVKDGTWDKGGGTWSTYTLDEHIYTVAGSAGLCGTEWKPADTANDMTEKTPGIYEKVYTGVAAGTYEFKVALNHAWDVAYPSDNYQLSVDKDNSTVTITFDPATKAVKAEVCAHAKYTDGICDTCGVACSHSWTDGTCTICNETCTHSWTDGVCDECGVVCDHSFDTVGLCTVCDLRKIWLNKSSWETATIYCSATSLEISMTKDTETGLWYGYIPETLEGFIFRRLYTNPYNGNQFCYQTAPLSLQENANCYRIWTDSRTDKDETFTYYTYDGNWYFHPCTEHTWKSGQCSLCGITCSHTGGTATCTEQAKCEVCGSWYGEKLAHNFYDYTGKCLNCGEFLAVLLETLGTHPTYYTHDQIASGKVFKYGASLKLFADIHMEKGACLELGYGQYTLDLNGYTLYSTGNHAVYVCEDLTVMDSSSAGNGQIQSNNPETGGSTGYPTAALYGMNNYFHITVKGDVALSGIVTFLSANNGGSSVFDLTQWNNAVDSSIHVIHATSDIYSSVLLPVGYGLTYTGTFVWPTYPVRASATLLVAKCDNHSGGTATCAAPAKCAICGESYGVPEQDNHTFDATTGKCGACGEEMTVVATVTDDTNTSNTYYAADADTLKQAVTAILKNDSQTFTVDLPADAPAEMFTAIRRALIDTEGVADGSVNLTLKGVTDIPGHHEFANEGPAIFGAVITDENGEPLSTPENVTQLASVNLPDVLTIGTDAFKYCEYLTSVTAPKVQTIGQRAFAYTALTAVEFPELTTIPSFLFDGVWTLTSAKFPKVTIIGDGGLLIGADFKPEAFPLELTAEGDITFNGTDHFNVESLNYSDKVDLVLCCNKADEVTGGVTWNGYTFKSITFTEHKYVDGTCTVCNAACDHSASQHEIATNMGDGTHSFTCTVCKGTGTGNHTFDSATGKCDLCDADVAVAKVTTSGGAITYYETLPAAVTAAQSSENSTVTLLKDVDRGSERLAITSGTLTIDLNDCTYKSRASAAIDINGATVTITDNGPNKEGTITGGARGVQVRSSGTLHLTGGTITASTGIYMYLTGTVNISGGTVIGTGSDSSAAAVYVYGMDTKSTICNITGGSISGAKYDLHWYDCTLTLALETGKTLGVTFPGGLTVDGTTLDEILGSGLRYWGVVDGKDTMLTVETSATEITDSGDITVRARCTHTGSQHTTATDLGNGTHRYTCTVCNNTSTKTHTMDAATGKCVCGLEMAVAKVTSNGTDTYYETLSGALTNAQSGDTVALCADVDTGTTVYYIPTGVTFDGGAYTLSGSMSFNYLYNRGTITGGTFNLSMRNLEGGVIAGGNFSYVTNENASITGGSFELIGSIFNDGNISGSIQFRELYYRCGTIDLSQAVLTGTEKFKLEEGFELTATGIKLDTDHFALARNGNIVSKLTGNGSIVVHESHSYSAVYDDTHHWTECACGVTTEKIAHTISYTHNSETHTASCSGCNNTGTEAHSTTAEGDKAATCTSLAYCTVCRTEYGQRLPHSFDTAAGECTVCHEPIVIDATGMTPEELHEAVTERLAVGLTDITVIMISEPEVEMFTAIRRALVDTEGVADGSIHLTLTGVTVIPNHQCYSNDVMFTPSVVFGELYGDPGERVTQLKSVDLPDVVRIGWSVFSGCENLTSVTAPKLQIVEESAFDETGLTSLYLPEATFVGQYAFANCPNLTTAKLPKATTIENTVFAILGEGNTAVGTALTRLEITSQDDIALSEYVMGYGVNFSEGVDLVLCGNKQSAVTDGLTWEGLTFKSITYVCIDGTADHKINGIDNGDGTHKKACELCGYVENESEDHSGGTATCTTLAKCEYCGAEHGDLADHVERYIADEEADTITWCCDNCDTLNLTFTLVIPTGVVYGASRPAVPHYISNDTSYMGITPEVTVGGVDYKVFTPNAGTYEVVMTWKEKSVTGEYTIAKANPTYTTPTGLTATYGDTLADVALPGGWAWKDSGASVGNAGSNPFTAVYTPADTTNFNTVERELTIVVAKATPVVTAPVAVENLIYSGTAQTLITAGSTTGGMLQYKVGDGQWSAQLPKATDAGEHTVYYKVVGDENHNDVAEQSITVTVGQKDLAGATVTLDKTAFTYDGQSHYPAVTVTLEGFGELEEGKDYRVFYTGATKMENGKPVKWFGDHVNSADCINAGDNYYAVVMGLGNFYTKDAFTLYENFVINPAPVTITGKDKTVTYNGEEIDLRELFTIDEHAGAADYTIIDLAGYGSFTGAPYLYQITKAGTFTVRLTTAATANYAAGEATAILTVNKAAGSGTVTIEGWTYGETAKAPAATGTGAATYHYSTADGKAPTDAGTYTVTATFAATDLYEEATATAEFTVSKKSVKVTADAQSKTYGENDPALTYLAEGLVGSDTLSGSLSRTTGENVGTYAIGIGTLANDNYVIDLTSANLTITPKTVSVLAHAVSKIYGDADPELTYTVVGLIGEDQLTGELKRVTGENAGTYLIEQNTLTAGGNYTITYTGAVFTIHAKTITAADVKLNGALTYNGKAQTQEVAVTEGISYTVSGNQGTQAGTYELTVTASGNYTGQVKLSWSIAPCQHAATKDDNDCTTEVVCPDCGTVTVEAYAAHSYTEPIEATRVLGTCTEYGSVEMKCERACCADHQTDPLPMQPDNHTGNPEYTYNSSTHSATYSCCKAPYVTDESHKYDETTHICVCGDVEKFMVTWTTGEGDNYEKEFAFGATITIPTSEFFQETFRKTNHTLIGWEGYTEGMTMPAGGVTFVAEYACNADALTHKAANAVTCVATGNIEYWICDCGKWYADANGKTEIADKTTVVLPVNAEAHAWDQGTVTTDPTCSATGVKTFICQHNSGHTYTEDVAIDPDAHDIQNHKAQAPTCTEKGWDAYVSCSRCDYSTYAEKAALGHDEVSHAAKAPTCTEKGWDAYVTCSRCDYSTYAEKAALGHDEVSHDAKAPTCTEKGWDAYVTCSRCDYTTYAEIPATGHTHKAVVTAPTCTVEGYTTYTCACGDAYVADKVAAKGHTPGAAATCTTVQTCTVCGAELAPVKGHTAVIDAAVAPTCTATGLTEGSHCSVCGETIKAQEVIPATGHTKAEAVIENKIEATCTKAGSYDEVVYCSVCDAELSRKAVVIPATGHTEELVAGKAATCTATGLTAGTKCALCGITLVKQERIPATGHAYADAWDTQCDNCGEEKTIETVAIHRVYNPNTGDHHYTMCNEECEDLTAAGWIYEGVAWNSAPSTAIPVYRLYNPNAQTGIHHYTGSTKERDWLVSLGWKYEGIGWYGLIK